MNSDLFINYVMQKRNGKEAKLVKKNNVHTVPMFVMTIYFYLWNTGLVKGLVTLPPLTHPPIPPP